MPDAMNIAQLVAPQAPTQAPQDEPRSTPALPGSEDQRPFAEVLKSKSASHADEKADDAPKSKVSDDASPQIATTATTQVPIDNPLATQLLAMLKADLPGREPLDGRDAQTKLDPASEMSEVPDTVQALLVPTDGRPDLVPTALPSNLPVVANSLPTGTKAPASLPKITGQTIAAGEPAKQTLAPLVEQDRSLPAASGNPVQQLSTATEHDPAAAPKPAMFAGSTAISAEGGKSRGEKALLDPGADFRPLMERVIEHTGNPGLQAVQAPTPAPAPQHVAEVTQIHIATPFQQAGWNQEVDQKLTWMVSNTRQQADLVLNPPQLGRVEVSIMLKGDEISASFTSPHQAVREAIEESLVRLRETLADAGINLGQTHVGRDSSRDAPFLRQNGGSGNTGGIRGEGPLLSTVPLNQGTTWQTQRGRGMVDVFA